MRYSRTHKQETRDRVLQVATKQIREMGTRSVGVSGIMAAAGLTHGGFYAHFSSKEDLLVGAIERMFVSSPSHMLDPSPEAPDIRLTAFFDYYLSPEHRDAAEGSCPLPVLVLEGPQLPDALQVRLTRGVTRMTTLICQHLEALEVSGASEEAVSCVSELIGALSLARSACDKERSDLILAASRSSIRRRTGH